MRHVICLFLLATLMLAACDKPEPRTPLQVGDHSIALVFPPDWEHINFGDKHQFRLDQERISLEDMGHRGRDMERAVERAMVVLKEDGRREKASWEPLIISDRGAVVVDTWDHLSHEYRKRYLFILNDRSLLVVYTMSGQFEKMESVFDEMAASIAFVDSVEQTGLGDGEDHPE